MRFPHRTVFPTDNTNPYSKHCRWTRREFSTAGKMGRCSSPCPLLFPLSLSHFYFSASRFPSAFNQGQYVFNQRFSFFMQWCPLKLFAAGWQLNSCQHPQRASPHVHAHPLPSQGSPSALEVTWLECIWACPWVLRAQSCLFPTAPSICETNTGQPGHTGIKPGNKDHFWKKKKKRKKEGRKERKKKEV